MNLHHRLRARLRARRPDRERRLLAASLNRLIAPEPAPRALPVRVRPVRARVEAAGPELALLERRLAGPDPVDARGLSLVRELLSDGAGPLFWDRSRESLGARAREALAALEPGAGEAPAEAAR